MPRTRGGAGSGFTLLELQVTLVVLAVGLMGIACLLALQGRQLRRVEAWCQASPTYYLLSRSHRCMRQLAAPADLTANPGQSSWTPPVEGEQKYRLNLNQVSHPLDSPTASADVTLTEID